MSRRSMPVVAVFLFFVCYLSVAFGETYHVVNLGSTLGVTNSYAYGINNAGNIVGYFRGTNGPFRAFYIQGLDWSDLGIAGTNTYALSLNNDGHVVGFAESTNVSSAFHFHGSTFTDLGLLGGTSSYAHGINRWTNIVGYIDTTNGAVGISYQNGISTTLANLGGTNSFAFAINDSNLIAGASLTASNNALNAFVLSSSGITNLNDILAAPSGWVLHEARGINSAGNTVGWGETNGVEHAFLLEGSALSEIAVFPGGTNSYALGLNDSNVVVGAATLTNGVLQAFLWRNGNLTNLNNLLPSGTGWELVESRGINNAGQIVGWGRINNQEQGFLLSPNQRPTVTVLAPTNNASLSYPSVVSISATASDSDGSISKVEFFANGVLIGTDTSAPYSLDWTCSSGAAYQLVARATDDSGGATDSSAVTLNFHGPPTVVITVPTNNTQFLNITNIAISVTATNPLSTVTNVGLCVDGTLKYSNSSAPWSFNWPNPASGAYTLTARARDSEGFSAISQPVDIAVYSGTNSPPSAPGAPSNLVAESLSPQQVSLRWSNASTGLVTKIERKNPGESRFYVVGVSQTGASSYLDGGLSTNSTYIYRIRAANAGGFSSYTSEVSVTTDASGDVLALSALQLWLRADGGVTLSGSNVSEWQDQGGKALAVAQSSSSARPGYSAAGFEGKPTLTFNGSQYLNFTSSNLLSSGSARTIILLGRTTSGTGGGAAFTFRRTGLMYCLEALNISGTFYLYSDGVNGANNATGPWGTLDSTFNPFVMVAKNGGSGTKIEVSLLGSTLTVSQSGSVASETGSTGFTAGGREDISGYNWRGDLAEVLVFSSKLSSSEHLAIERLLLRRYQMVPSVSNLVAEALSGSQASVSWKNNKATTNTVLTIERKIGSGGSYSTVGQVTNRSSYIDTGLNAGTTYFYRVKASHPYMGESGYSNEASVTPVARSDWPLADLNLWLRGDRVSASPAASWEDQSGKKNDAVQATSSKQPTVVTNAVNGWPTVKFDGTNDTMWVTNRTGTNNFTVLAIAKSTVGHEIDGEGHDGLDGNSGQRYLFSAGQLLPSGSMFNTTNAGANVSVGTNGISYYSYEVRPVGSAVNIGTSVFEGSVGSGFKLVEFSMMDKAPSLFLNGNVLRMGLRSQRDAIHAPVQVGGYEYGYFQGEVAEVLIFGKILSLIEKQSVYAYLNGRYNLITNQPTAPSGLTASVVSLSQISLVWTDSGEGAVNLCIERKTGVGGTYQVVTAMPAGKTSFLDGSLQAGTEYFYRLQAENLAGNSSYSTEASATTLNGGSSIPTSAITLWLKGDGLTSKGTNNSVNKWIDESGTANHAEQAISIQQPVWVANQANGRPVLRFSRTNDNLIIPDVPGTNNFAVFAVAMPTASHHNDAEGDNAGGNFGQRYLFSNHYPTGSATNGQASLSVGTNGFSAYDFEYNSAGANYWPALAVSGSSIANLSLLTTSYLERRPTLYLNGGNTRSGLSSPRNPELASRVIGDSQAFAFQGDIAEIIAFQRALSAQEMEAVNSYLLQKYSLSNNAPAGATNVLVTAQSSTGLLVSWAPAALNESRVEVERKIGTNGVFTLIGYGLPGATNYLDTVNASTQAIYRVRSASYFGSAYSPESGPPTALIAAPTNGAIVLTNSSNTITTESLASPVTVVKMELYTDSVLIATSTNSPFTFTWSPNATGTNFLNVRVTDSHGNTRISDSISIRIMDGTDSDGDGLSDYEETGLGTDPNLWDTDADGVSDSQDAFPLDPTRTATASGLSTSVGFQLFTPLN